MKTRRANRNYKCWECAEAIKKGEQYARRSVCHGKVGIGCGGNTPQIWEPYRVAEPICAKCAERGRNDANSANQNDVQSGEEETARDLLVELVAVLKTIPDTCDFDDLGDRIKIYLGEDE